MGVLEFINQLKALGYDVRELGDGRIWFPYVVPCGRFADQEIKLGLQAPADFPLSPPPGPHISPRLLPLAPGGSHPAGGIHASPYGPEWQYWSRPMQHWARTKRTARDVMAHLHHLFDTQ
jgi:hypothetical protein